MRFIVDAQVSARSVEVRVVTEAGEDIEHFPALGGGLADPSRSQ